MEAADHERVRQPDAAKRTAHFLGNSPFLAQEYAQQQAGRCSSEVALNALAHGASEGQHHALVQPVPGQVLHGNDLLGFADEERAVDVLLGQKGLVVEAAWIAGGSGPLQLPAQGHAVAVIGRPVHVLYRDEHLPCQVVDGAVGDHVFQLDGKVRSLVAALRLLDDAPGDHASLAKDLERDQVRQRGQDCVDVVTQRAQQDDHHPQHPAGPTRLAVEPGDRAEKGQPA